MQFNYEQAIDTISNGQPLNEASIYNPLPTPTRQMYHIEAVPIEDVQAMQASSYNCHIHHGQRLVSYLVVRAAIISTIKLLRLSLLTFYQPPTHPTNPLLLSGEHVHFEINFASSQPYILYMVDSRGPGISAHKG